MHGHRVARYFLGQMITSPRLSSILMTLRLYGSWMVSLVCLTSSLPLLPELPFPFFRSSIYLSLMPWYPQSDMPYLRCLMCSVPVFNVNCGSPECVHKLHALCTSEATHRPRICLESANCLVVPIRGQVAVSPEPSISANASLPREVRAPSPDLLLFASSNETFLSSGADTDSAIARVEASTHLLDLAGTGGTRPNVSS